MIRSNEAMDGRERERESCMPIDDDDDGKKMLECQIVGNNKN